MMDLAVLGSLIAIATIVSVGFALAGWYAYQRAQERGLVVAWLGATAAGTAFLASGLAAPRGVQNGAEFLGAMLASAVVFGIGAFVVGWYPPVRSGEEGAGPTEAPTFPIGLAIRVAAAMLVAMVVALIFLVLAMPTEEL